MPAEKIVQTHLLVKMVQQRCDNGLINLQLSLINLMLSVIGERSIAVNILLPISADAFSDSDVFRL